MFKKISLLESVTVKNYETVCTNINKFTRTKNKSEETIHPNIAVTLTVKSSHSQVLVFARVGTGYRLSLFN